MKYQMTSLGITEDMLRQDINHGVRSPVIATYRILLHKQMGKGYNRSNYSLKSGKSLSEKKLTNTKASPGPVNGREQHFQGTKKQKSKTCILL